MSLKAKLFFPLNKSLSETISQKIVILEMSRRVPVLILKVQSPRSNPTKYQHGITEWLYSLSSNFDRSNSEYVFEWLVSSCF